METANEVITRLVQETNARENHERHQFLDDVFELVVAGPVEVDGEVPDPRHWTLLIVTRTDDTCVLGLPFFWEPEVVSGLIARDRPTLADAVRACQENFTTLLALQQS